MVLLDIKIPIIQHYITDFLYNVLEDFKISYKIISLTTDNGANIMACEQQYFLLSPLSVCCTYN